MGSTAEFTLLVSGAADEVARFATHPGVVPPLGTWHEGRTDDAEAINLYLAARSEARSTDATEASPFASNVPWLPCEVDATEAAPCHLMFAWASKLWPADVWFDECARLNPTLRFALAVDNDWYPVVNPVAFKFLVAEHGRLTLATPYLEGRRLNAFLGRGNLIADWARRWCVRPGPHS
jgi:hypothetical protein